MQTRRASVLPMASQILDPLRCRQDEHHRDDGRGSEILERKWHTILFLPGTYNPFLVRQGTAQFV